MKPYFDDGVVQLYCGDMREVLPALDLQADCCVTDPPYAETSLAWDRWPDGWPALVAEVTSSMWCFGSMRMFLDRRDEFDGWRMSQDVVWEKANGTSFASDRFKRVHETATHWYRDNWNAVQHDTPRIVYTGRDEHNRIQRNSRTPHTGEIGGNCYQDDGTRLMRSVFHVPSIRGGVHPTQKPTGILDPLIRYACPPGGLVLDVFAGSCSTLEAARASGRRAVGIEADDAMCSKAARRLSQAVLV